MKHATCTIYTPNFGDCTNNGISKGKTLMTIFDDCTSEEAIAYCTEHNIPLDNALIADHSPSCSREYLKAVPLVLKRKGLIGPMFGGNYAYDYNKDFPRYSTMPDMSVPIPIHDRYETPEEYATLSI